MTQTDSECPAARSRHHAWVVERHNADWTRLGCVCGRCGAKSVMSSDDYIQLLAAAKRAWDAYMARDPVG